jgi:cytoskeletal protein CcmA (bactofilin family)
MFFRKQKAVGNDNHPEPVATTVIGSDTAIEGNIDTAGELRIEGSVRGSIRAGTCIVEAGGVIQGEVSAADMIVYGQVIGPVQANHVHLQNGAAVEGDITSDTIAIETGARLTGAVWQNDRRQETNGRQAPGLGDLHSPFGSLSWNDRPDDFRPLKVVKPRAVNGSGY